MIAWGVPQYIVAALLVVGTLIDLFGNKPAEKRTIGFLSKLVTALLLIWGGFWS